MDPSRDGFLRAPGVPRLVGSLLIGRLPAGMPGLAIMVRITQDGGSCRASTAVAVGG